MISIGYTSQRLSFLMSLKVLQLKLVLIRLREEMQTEKSTC
jgi:hypothetical protein